MDSIIDPCFSLGTLSPLSPLQGEGSQRGSPHAPDTQLPAPLPQRDQRLRGSRRDPVSSSASVASSESSPALATTPHPTAWSLRRHNPAVAPNDDVVMELSQQNVTQLLQQEKPRSLSRMQEELSRVPLTPVRRLRAAVQTHLLHTSSTPAPGPDTPTRRRLQRPTRHQTTLRKAQEWSLHVTRKWLIIGDSNVCKLPAYTNEHLPIDGFPGATFRNVELLMDKTTAQVDVEKVIVAVGLNNRVQKTRETALKQLQSAMNNVRRTFPSAEIFVSQINFSSGLPQKEKLRLTHLNSAISSRYEYIPALPTSLFSTGGDNIHWSRGTASRIFDHWVHYLN